MSKYEEEIDDIIEIDVGGKEFKTRKSVLMNSEYFNSMFSHGFIESSNDNKEKIFIDRNPRHFEWILEVLRTGEVINIKDEYMPDLRFFGIDISPPKWIEPENNDKEKFPDLDVDKIKYKFNPSFVKKIEDYNKENFWGRQDDHFKDNFSYMDHPSPINRIKLKANGTVGFNRRVCYTVPRIGTIIQNLRTNIPDEYIEEICIEIGGQRIDKIYGKVFKYLRTIYNIEDNSIIPFYITSVDTINIFRLCYHEVKIHVYLSEPYLVNGDEDKDDWKSDYGFWLDFRESRHNIDIKEDIEKYIYQLQYTGEEKCGYNGSDDRSVCRRNDSGIKLRLSFNHPVYGMLIVGYEKREGDDLRLLLNGEEFEIPEDQFVQMDKNCYYINFYSGINFSRIDNVTLTLSNRCGCPWNIYVISGQPIHYVQGMAGLRYSR